MVRYIYGSTSLSTQYTQCSHKKGATDFFRRNFYKYWRIFIIFRAQFHWHKNFLPHLHYVATILCKSVRHKSNTFRTILALCTCSYPSLHLRKPVSMKQTKHSRKSEAHNLCSKCPPFTRAHAFKRHTPLRNRCRDDGVVLAASTLSADVLSTALHNKSANGRSSLEGYPRCQSDGITLITVARIQISGRIKSGVSLIHGERRDFSEVNITSPGKGCTWHAT